MKVKRSWDLHNQKEGKKKKKEVILITNLLY